MKADRVKKILVGFLVFFVVVIVAEIFFLYSKGALNIGFLTSRKESPSPTIALVPTTRPTTEIGLTAEIRPTAVLAETPNDFFLNLPVEKQYFDSALLDNKDPQVISFFLPDKTPIRAVFSGKITKVLFDQRPFPNDASFNEIWLEKNSGEFWASYVLVGEILVKEGQEVGEGEVLAEAGEGGLNFRSGTNLSFWLHNKSKNNESQMVKLSKEMFK